jgi:hypothetical protein
VPEHPAIGSLGGSWRGPGLQSAGPVEVLPVRVGSGLGEEGVGAVGPRVESGREEGGEEGGGRREQQS